MLPYIVTVKMLDSKITPQKLDFVFCCLDVIANQSVFFPCFVSEEL